MAIVDIHLIYDAISDNRMVSIHVQLIITGQVYDYLLTLDLEIQWIWKSRWSIVRVLYHLVRFLPFISLFVILFIGIPGLGTEKCSKLHRIYGYITVANLTLSEGLLTLRTWAVCGRSRSMTVLLTVLYVSFTIPSIVNIVLLYND
ncbi:hypothetical protein AMATHDRAFT_62601 [Amanita thiersii Skay4041]|uniref:DUF6533 domain-containing protein n=1 Tax=Amanita thiersii Skay4041 TaxID=703135 RepID=A0A2A9NFE6_9AGAR|nr:hypothetical protein AMATHDRAFT_62601 [Amanita thiersii Skay4041]